MELWGKIDVDQWRETPCLRGRIAVEQDVKDGVPFSTSGIQARLEQFILISDCRIAASFMHRVLTCQPLLFSPSTPSRSITLGIARSVAETACAFFRKSSY
jgi:hypothetical protein